MVLQPVVRKAQIDPDPTQRQLVPGEVAQLHDARHFGAFRAACRGQVQAQPSGRSDGRHKGVQPRFDVYLMHDKRGGKRTGRVQGAAGANGLFAVLQVEIIKSDGAVRLPHNANRVGILPAPVLDTGTATYRG